MKGGEKLMAKQYRYRSAVNGQFVTDSYAKRHPNTTVKETVKPKKDN